MNKDLKPVIKMRYNKNFSKTKMQISKKNP